jgi:hypothetical protein
LRSDFPLYSGKYWGENMKAIPELDKLFEEVGTYRSSTDYKELLSFVKKFRHMAPYNAMLLHVQKPGSVYVASASDWQNRFERHPKLGARPLVILRPFGPVSFVYELSDTEGKAFPKKLEEPFLASGEITNQRIEVIRRSMYYEGIATVEQDYATTLAGNIRAIHDTGEFKAANTSKIFKLIFGMVLNKNIPNASKLATIFHELGHAFCGHLYQPDAKWLPQRYGLTDNEEEFEAESACWLLCERLGIDNPSAEYLSGYLNNNSEIPNISIDAVLKAVGMVERILGGINSPKKELIIK